MDNFKTAKTSHHIIIFIVLLLVTVATYVYTIIKTGITLQVIISIVITFVFYCIIILFYRKWYRLFYKPTKMIIAELKAFKEKIDNINYSKYPNAINYIHDEKESVFSNIFLKNALKDYVEEMERLEVENSNNYRCDISDYIYYERICENVRKGYAESIANSMIGLGILGTFVGLAFGLQFFDVSTMSAMENSISPLIDGIKTAFYTSIYGVVISLVVNNCIKYIL